MDNKTALLLLKTLKVNLSRVSSDPYIYEYKKDALQIIEELLGESSKHFQSIDEAKNLSYLLQKEVILKELDLLIKELSTEDETGSAIIELFPENAEKAIKAPKLISPTSNEQKNRVFIVHGRDETAKEKVARFLEGLGLESILLHEQPNKGRTIIEKFEDHSSRADFAIILLTPDDVGGLASESSDISPRARQNVIFEMGFFFGKLGKGNVCALYEGVEQPSDLRGIIHPFRFRRGMET